MSYEISCPAAESNNLFRRALTRKEDDGIPADLTVRYAVFDFVFPGPEEVTVIGDRNKGRLYRYLKGCEAGGVKPFSRRTTSFGVVDDGDGRRTLEEGDSHENLGFDRRRLTATTIDRIESLQRAGGIFQHIMVDLTGPVTKATFNRFLLESVEPGFNGDRYGLHRDRYRLKLGIIDFQGLPDLSLVFATDEELGYLSLGEKTRDCARDSEAEVKRQVLENWFGQLQASTQEQIKA